MHLFRRKRAFGINPFSGRRNDGYGSVDSSGNVSVKIDQCTVVSVKKAHIIIHADPSTGFSESLWA